MRGVTRAVVVVAAALTLTFGRRRDGECRWASPTAPPPGDSGDSTSAGMQHGQPGGHLPGSSANVELIGELEPTDEFGPIVPGQIADLAVYKDFAYLNSWNEETCTKGGVYVVDIRDPRQAEEVDFIPAVPGQLPRRGRGRPHGEHEDVQGRPARGRTTRSASTPTAGGGFDLYDVTDPRNPKVARPGRRRPRRRGAG